MSIKGICSYECFQAGISNDSETLLASVSIVTSMRESEIESGFSP